MSAVLQEKGGAPAKAGAARRARLNPKYLPLAATISLFVLMGTLGSVLYTGFFSAQVFLNLLIDNAFLIVVAVGMTFVILSGGIDLSVGSVIALTTMVSAPLVPLTTSAFVPALKGSATSSTVPKAGLMAMVLVSPRLPWSLTLTVSVPVVEVSIGWL